MAIITLKDPTGPYKSTTDTDVMEIEIRNAFLGVRFVTEDGECLSVSMRDSGFEVHYFGEDGTAFSGFDAGWVDFKASTVTHNEKARR